MKKALTFFGALMLGMAAYGQTNPAITAWMINTSGAKGQYYLSGASTPTTDVTLANVQQVRYSANNAYINATGIPSYAIGPYAIGTVTKALDNAYLIKIPLNPVAATTHSAIGMGAIAVFINGTVAYAARDAATYMNQGKWHQNAVYFENLGFDCAHGHPGPMTSDYHVHQNPSAFNTAVSPTSTICNVYLADGLYVPDSTERSPLIGFAADGFPIYGAYGYSDPLDTTSALKRIASSYRLRSISSRTTLPDGTAATGPALTDIITSPLVGSTPLPASLGAYEEDYEYVPGLGDLDEYNGRFCKTPEYPAGMYCYFATLDAQRNPAYPYLIGGKFYGVAPASGPGMSFTHSTITETVTTYNPALVAQNAPKAGSLNVIIFPNPSRDLVTIQCSQAANTDRKVTLTSYTGEVVGTQIIPQGSTMCYFNAEVLYPGTYIATVQCEGQTLTAKVVIQAK